VGGRGGQFNTTKEQQQQQQQKAYNAAWHMYQNQLHNARLVLLSPPLSARRLRGMVVEQSPRGPQGGGIRASVRRRAGLLIFSRDPASKLGPHPRPHHPPRHHHPAHPLHTDQFLTPSPSPSELHTLHARPPPSLPLTPIHLLASHLRHTSGSSFLYIHPSYIQGRSAASLVGSAAQRPCGRTTTPPRRRSRPMMEGSLPT
jgi:hypothetical protein